MIFDGNLLQNKLTVVILTTMTPRKTATKTTTPTPAPKSEVKRRNRKPWSEDEHIINAYLRAVTANPPKPGRPINPERIQARLDQLNERIAKASPIVKLRLLSERNRLKAQLGNNHNSKASNLETLEDEFLNVIWEYSKNHGLGYAEWREAGVPARVLQAAGFRPGKKAPVRHREKSDETI
jgi:hypothetical protein